MVATIVVPIEEELATNVVRRDILPVTAPTIMALVEVAVVLAATLVESRGISHAIALRKAVMMRRNATIVA